MATTLPQLLRKVALRASSLIVGTAALGVAQAQGPAPSHPASNQVIRLVTPFNAGNPLDANLRLLAEALRQTTGRNYIVDNKPGAGGIIAASEVARAKPDGSVLLFTTGGHNTAAALYKKLPFDVSKDFTAISLLTRSPGFVLLVRSDSRFKSLADVLKEAKSRPGAVSYASWGVGNTTHLVGALLEKSTNTSMLHVPYKGSPLQDLLGGQFDMTWLGSSLALPLIQERKVRALAITADKRWSALPDVPTLLELGIKDVDVPAWAGIYAPAGMDATVSQRIYADIATAVKQPEYQANAKALGSDVIATSPREFDAYTKAELSHFMKILPPLGISLD